MWSCSLYSRRSTFWERSRSGLETHVPLHGDWGAPRGLPHDCPGCTDVFWRASGFCNMLRWESEEQSQSEASPQWFNREPLCNYPIRSHPAMMGFRIRWAVPDRQTWGEDEAKEKERAYFGVLETCARLVTSFVFLECEWTWFSSTSLLSSAYCNGSQLS